MRGRIFFKDTILNASSVLDTINRVGGRYNKLFISQQCFTATYCLRQFYVYTIIPNGKLWDSFVPFFLKYVTL